MAYPGSKQAEDGPPPLWFLLLELLLALGITFGISRLAMQAWAIWRVAPMILPVGVVILHALTAIVAGLVVQSLPRWKGALWAGLPAVLLIPLSPALANIMWTQEWNPRYVNALYHVILVGPVYWAPLLLDAAWPRWIGLLLGGFLLAGALYLLFALSVAAALPGDLPIYRQEVTEQMVVIHALPVWVAYAVTKLVGLAYRRVLRIRSAIPAAGA